jgi:hypothetical protein
MSTTVQRPLKIIAFSANGIGWKAYEVRKQLQDLKIDVALFAETRPKPHMRFCIFIGLAVKTGTKAEMP